jgi:hypothetical protein
MLHTGKANALSDQSDQMHQMDGMEKEVQEEMGLLYCPSVPSVVPQHIAVIMDGNRRFGKQVCVICIGVVSVVILYNFVYCCDTCYIYTGASASR